MEFGVLLRVVVCCPFGPYQFPRAKRGDGRGGFMDYDPILCCRNNVDVFTKFGSFLCWNSIVEALLQEGGGGLLFSL